MNTIKSLILVLLPLLFTPIAYATPPTIVGGTFTASVVPGSTSTRTADGNIIITQMVTFTISGGVSGTYVGEERDVLHPDGTLNIHGIGTFTGSVMGSSPGMSAASYTGTGISGGSFMGHFLLDRGTSGLAGVHVQGTFSGTFTSPTSSAGTYSGLAHFD